MKCPVSWDQDLFKRTLDFAADAHHGQMMQGSSRPYTVHLVKVATEILCAHEPGAVDVNFAMQCALLHDVLEDTKIGREALAKEFSDEVAAGVAALTKNSALPPTLQMPDSLWRIRQSKPEVAMVKMADRITNLEPAPSHWTAEKRLEYRAEANQILEALRNAHAGLATRLELKIAAYQ